MSEFDRTLVRGKVLKYHSQFMLKYLMLAISTDYPAPKKIIQEIRKHGSKYRDAIDMSIQTAQDGYNFGIEAIDLCDLLLDPEISLEDLQEYVRSMQDAANRAHRAAAETLQMFNSVQQPIKEVRRL